MACAHRGSAGSDLRDEAEALVGGDDGDPGSVLDAELPGQCLAQRSGPRKYLRISKRFTVLHDHRAIGMGHCLTIKPGQIARRTPEDLLRITGYHFLDEVIGLVRAYQLGDKRISQIVPPQVASRCITHRVHPCRQIDLAYRR